MINRACWVDGTQSLCVGLGVEEPPLIMNVPKSSVAPLLSKRAYPLWCFGLVFERKNENDEDCACLRYLIRISRACKVQIRN